MRPYRRPAFEAYSAGRRDARIGEARAFLMGARHLRNLTAHGLSCGFNLREETAGKLLEMEQFRRDSDGAPDD